MRRSSAILFVLLACLLPARRASAARSVARPALEQFADGYGFVAAEVVEATPVRRATGFVERYDVAFRVKQVYAPPIGGGFFPARAGDVIRVRLSAGYSAQVEWTPAEKLAPGERFVLTLKHDAANRYEHTTGASAARGVEAFDAADARVYARLRDLALLPPQQRTPALLAVVADSDAPDMLRSQALAGLNAWHHDFPDAERAVIAAGLRRSWSDPHVSFPLELRNDLDHTLRQADRDFEHSADRARVWTDALLKPTAANLEDDNDRDNSAMSIFADLLKHRPEIAGPPLLAALEDQRYPVAYRCCLARALRFAYEEAETPDPAWEPALQTHFARVLVSGESWPIRLAAGDIQRAADREDGRRKFLANAEGRAALDRALLDMTAAARLDPQSQAATAAREVADALRAVERELKRRGEE